MSIQAAILVHSHIAMLFFGFCMCHQKHKKETFVDSLFISIIAGALWPVVAIYLFLRGVDEL